MQVKQLKNLVITALEDSKARDIIFLDVHTLTDITDYMIICSGTSNRHTRSIANNLAVQAKEQGAKPLAVEGTETGEWILVDLIDVVVHIMLPQTREFYGLEKLWGVAKEKKAKTATTETKSKAKALKKTAPKAKSAQSGLKTKSKPKAKATVKSAPKPKAKAKPGVRANAKTKTPASRRSR